MISKSKLFKYIIGACSLGMLSIPMVMGLTSCSTFNPQASLTKPDNPSNNKPNKPSMNNSVDYSDERSIIDGMKQSLNKSEIFYKNNFSNQRPGTIPVFQNWNVWNENNNWLSMQKFLYEKWNDWINTSNADYLTVGYYSYLGLEELMAEYFYLCIGLTSLNFYKYVNLVNSELNNYVRNVIPIPSKERNYLELLNLSWNSYSDMDRHNTSDSYRQYLEYSHSDIKDFLDLKTYSELLYSTVYINKRVMTSMVPENFFSPAPDPKVNFWEFYNNPKDYSDPNQIVIKQKRITEGYQKIIDLTTWTLNKLQNGEK